MTRVFPALLNRPESVSGPLAEEGEGSCFFHPKKRAQSVCSRCGRFVCALCEVPAKDGVLCPTCLAGKNAAGEDDIARQGTLYDSLALALAGIPLLFVFPVVVTAPAAMVMSIRYWKRPLSPVRRSRWRFVLAMALSAAEMAVVASLIIRWI
ncbi:MAG: hypothetical protein JRI97_02455 [Deltaproteobacteria bacterium]|nr:hypothetical protein [Deltaproteobacteria bacterium]